MLTHKRMRHKANTYLYPQIPRSLHRVKAQCVQWFSDSRKAMCSSCVWSRGMQGSVGTPSMRKKHRQHILHQIEDGHPVPHRTEKFVAISGENNIPRSVHSPTQVLEPVVQAHGAVNVHLTMLQCKIRTLAHVEHAEVLLCRGACEVACS